MKMSNRVRSLINVALFCAMVFMNYLANALPLNGVTQKQISADYQIYLTPAGYVFAIWGIIYLGLLAFIITQALPKWRDDKRLRMLDLPFVTSCLCNMIWLTVWHYRYVPLSVVVMLGLLGSVMWAYVRLDKQRQSANQPVWFVERTFSVYLGWVCLATMLNIAVLLYTLGWNGAPLSPQTWTVILLFVACGLFAYLGVSRRDTSILGVLLWASVGIGIKNQGDTMIVAACVAVVVACVAVAVRIFFLKGSMASLDEQPLS